MGGFFYTQVFFEALTNAPLREFLRFYEMKRILWLSKNSKATRPEASLRRWAFHHHGAFQRKQKIATAPPATQSVKFVKRRLRERT